MKIMEMSNGTKIKNCRSELNYILGDYVNDVAREITLECYGSIDYINKNTQDEYEVIEEIH